MVETHVTGTSKHFMPLRKKLEVYEFLKTVTTIHGEFCIYNTGWSDTRAAERLNVTATNVAHVRKELIGQLKMGNPGNLPQSKLAARVQAMESWLAQNFGFVPGKPQS